MKKIMLIFMLLLAGCSYDTIAMTEPPLRTNFEFDDQLVVVQPAMKVFYPRDEVNYMQFTIFTTEQQAAYLRTSMHYLQAEMNGITFHTIDVSIGKRYERSTGSFYTTTITIKVDEQQALQLGKEITSLKLFVQDQQLLEKDFSRVSIASQKSALDVHFHRKDDVVYGYFLENLTYDAIQLADIYMEGVNGVAVTVPNIPLSIAAKERVKILQKLETYQQSRIQGPIGIYAIFEDGTEQVIGVHDLVLEDINTKTIDELNNRLLK